MEMLLQSFVDWHATTATDGRPIFPLETYDDVDINELLQKFIISMRKVDGTLYNSKTVHAKIAGIQRYLLLKSDGKKGRILDKNNPIYRKTREVLDCQLQELTRQGYGGTERAQHLPVESEKKIMDKCSPNDPEGLLSRVIIHIHKGFSLRGGAGYRLDVEEVIPKVDDDGQKYFGWMPTERRIYAVPGPYCPYNDIEKYLEKRPKLGNCKNFFLQICFDSKDSVWYKSQAMSYKTLAWPTRNHANSYAPGWYPRKRDNGANRASFSGWSTEIYAYC